MGMLDDKIAIITGASRGIGLAIAECFAKEGAELVLISRNKEKLGLIKTQLEAVSEKPVHIFPGDVSQYEDLKTIFNSLQSKNIVADILVNNAGVMHTSTLQMAKPEMIGQTFSTNVMGSVYCAQFSLKSFLKKRKGSIINLTSIIATHGSPGQSLYGSSKAAIIGFTKSLSKELAPLDIRVNAIAPGFIETEMTASVPEKNKPSIGMKRAGKPEDVAKVALFLASDLSGYVTGQVIGVDGGMII